MKRASKSTESQAAILTVDDLSSSRRFREDLELALEVPEEAEPRLGEALRELLDKDAKEDAADRLAGALGVPPEEVNRTLASLVAILKVEELASNRTEVLPSLARQLKLTPAKGRRLAKLLEALRPGYEEAGGLDVTEWDRKALLGRHLPVWEHVNAKMVYGVDHERFGTGEIPVLPIMIIRLGLEGASEKQEVTFQADAQDLARLIDTLGVLKKGLEEACESVNSGERMLAIGPASRPSSVSRKGRRKKRARRSS